MNTRTAPELAPLSHRPPLLDSADGQLYATTFSPLVEGQEARLLLQPGRGIGIVPGTEIDYRGPTKRYRLRVLAYLLERGARGKPKATSNRLSVRVLAIGEDSAEELVPCTVCKGSGAVEIPGTCPECHGHAHGCADCEGTGRIDWSECRACHGRGRSPRHAAR
jgi:hypothetical protein